MYYALSPVWLMLLHSIAGYSEQEVADIGGWCSRTVARRIKEWQIRPPDPTSKGSALRAHLDAIRVRRGSAAARRAAAHLLLEIAGPSLRNRG